MQRRHFLFIAPLLPSALLAPRLFRAPKNRIAPANNIRDEALRLNELASSIHSPEDARRLVDCIAEIFADDLPPAWATESLRGRLAQTEYITATDPQKRISEQHLATAWNTCVTTLSAPDTSQASAPEIHNLRDGLFATACLTWNRGYRNIWSVPSIFATQPNGTLAPACRLVESLRILWDLADIPENLSAARERVSKGVLTSDLFKQAQQKPSSSPEGRSYLSVAVSYNNVRSAEQAYIRANGIAAFNNVVEAMLNSLLSA